MPARSLSPAECTAPPHDAMGGGLCVYARCSLTCTTSTRVGGGVGGWMGGMCMGLRAALSLSVNVYIYRDRGGGRGDGRMAKVRENAGTTRARLHASQSTSRSGHESTSALGERARGRAKTESNAPHERIRYRHERAHACAWTPSIRAWQGPKACIYTYMVVAATHHIYRRTRFESMNYKKCVAFGTCTHTTQLRRTAPTPQPPDRPPRSGPTWVTNTTLHTNTRA